MSLTVEEVINKLKNYDGYKKVRVLFGMPTPILWLSHQDMMFDFDYHEGCSLFTSSDIANELDEYKRIENVNDLLWHLQFYKKDEYICNCDLCGCNSYIKQISDEVKDAEGNIIDIVFLIPFAHMVG